MSPTVFCSRGYRFYFFSREEARAHVHVQHESGEAKFWLDPEVNLAQNYGLSSQRIGTVLRIIKEHESEIRVAWKEHFGR
jgi:CRISPR/Cas system-associated endonuclease Cas1